ncbi:MAG: hypothetical protein KKF33_20250 [Alphaproteobacteria bacterium]|nr:hypothetical protein [Alphaproteobacteria bacterium]
MADSYRAWLRGAVKWQDIAVIDLRDEDGTGKRLQSCGLKTLGQIDKMEGPALLDIEGMGIGVIKRVRAIIKKCKATERRRRPTSPGYVRTEREFPE